MALGDSIPPLVEIPPESTYTYWRRSGQLLFLAGHAPRWGRTDFRYTGKVGSDLTIADGYAAARLTGLNLLQTTRQALGTLNNIVQLVDVFGVVNSAPGFTDQSKVGPRYAGVILGLQATAGNLAGAISPIVAGAILARTGNFNAVFYLIVVLLVVSAIIWNLFATGEKVVD
jgi:nitrate/nitrite transporter NarK